MRTPTSGGRGDAPFLRTNAGLLYLAVALAVPMYVVGYLVGLGPQFTTPILLLVVAATYAILRWRGRGRTAGPPGTRAITSSGVIAAVAVFAAIQLVPFGRGHTNPAVTAEPNWPDATTRELVVRACYDCHSNEVEYPWYSHVAPISWAIADHVREGRDALNFSEFDRRQRGADEVVETIQEGSMPPSYFTRFGLHATATLSAADKAKLVAALKTMPEFQRGG